MFGFRVTGQELYRASAEEVYMLRQFIDGDLPEGYLEFVTTYGEGILGGSYIRGYPPHRITNELPEWLKRIAEYWFWGDGVCSQEFALMCVLLGDTVDGEEMIFSPKDPSRFYVLPRHEERTDMIGTILSKRSSGSALPAV